MFKPISTSGHKSVNLARRTSKHVMLAMLVLSLLVPLLLTPEFLQTNLLTNRLVAAGLHFIPAILHMAAVSEHPDYTAAVFSLNWLFVPLLTAALVAARPPWIAEVREVYARRYRSKGWFARWIGMPAFGITLVLMDLQVIPLGFGFYSMTLAPFVMKVSALHVIDKSPLAIAVFYWAGCVWEAMMYSTVIFLFGWLGWKASERWGVMTSKA